jgi:hypothetical protein
MQSCPLHEIPESDCPECWGADTEELDTIDLVPYVDADEPTLPATPESHQHARSKR